MRHPDGETIRTAAASPFSHRRTSGPMRKIVVLLASLGALAPAAVAQSVTPITPATLFTSVTGESAASLQSDTLTTLLANSLDLFVRLSGARTQLSVALFHDAILSGGALFSGGSISNALADNPLGPSFIDVSATDANHVSQSLSHESVGHGGPDVVTPEPATLMLTATGLFSLSALVHRRRTRDSRDA